MGLMDTFRISLNLYRNRFAGKQASRPTRLDAVQQHYVEELRRHGVVRIENYLDEATCTHLRAVIDATIGAQDMDDLMHRSKDQPKFGRETGKGYNIWTDHEGSDIRLIHAEAIDPAIRAFYLDNRLVEVGAAYLNADLAVRYTMANRVMYKEQNLGSGGGWHRDMVYKRGFKAMVYLTDVDEHTGPFQYIPSSSSLYYHLFKAKHADQYQFSHEEVLSLIGGDEAHIVSATAKAGTLLLFETNLIHRGKPIDPGHTRYAMTNYHNL